jgi:hypothetical protein
VGPRGTRLAVAAVSALVIALIFGQSGSHAQTSPGPLPYSRGLLVTGDYAIGGINVTGSTENGLATGTISLSGVPLNAEILAAYLYWETITTIADPSEADGVTFRGSVIDLNNVRDVKKTSVPLTGQTAACWSSGAPLQMTMYRANVLGLLPVQNDANNNSTGRRLVNDADLVANGLPPHTVMLPKFGTGNQVPESAGASLVVIYRDPEPDSLLHSNPLRKIVIYDGLYIQLPGETMSQQLQGIYRSAANKSARVTHIAASGQKNPTERLFFNGTRIAGAPNLPEPFPDSPTASDRAWANPTYDVSSLMVPDENPTGYGETVTTAVDHTKENPYECITWSAVIFSTAIEDADRDGIPDGIEDAASPLTDPTGVVLPDLHAMGANSKHKDIFIEMNAMWAPAGTTYGSGPDLVEDETGHNHLPSPQVLKLIGDTFKNAPFSNPEDPLFPNGIKAHFDVGNIDTYRSHGVVPHAEWVDDYTSTEADEYLIPSAFARGGEAIEEKACVPSDTVTCLFPDFPGTVGWRYGLQAYRDAPVGVNGEELSAAQLEDWLEGGTHRRRFDPARTGLFHYVFYGHARGKPRSLFPCLDADNEPTSYGNGGTCAVSANPDFHKPTSASGVGDLPGNTVMITLGFWDEFLGKPYVQASTTTHELGHNAGLWHGGFPVQWGNSQTPTYFEPNCKPNYLSAMSYLFQVHGLLDDFGNIHLDYSRDLYADVDESSLALVAFNAPLRYRTAWYAPLLPGTFGYLLGVSPATRFCGGAVFPDPLPDGWVTMGRIDSGDTNTFIDWMADRDPLNWRTQDVNFDGLHSASPPLRGFDDWANLQLNHVGSGLNAAGQGEGIFADQIGGIFADQIGGIFADQTGGIFADQTGGIFADQIGGIFADQIGGIFADQIGGIFADQIGGIFADQIGGQELTLEAAKRMGRTPPNPLKACVIGVNCTGSPSPFHRTRLEWKAPNVGHAFKYRVYRARGASVTTGTPLVLVAEVNAPTTTAVDHEELPDGIQFTYFVTVEFDDETPHPVSGPSNFVTITAVNEAPVAFGDSYQTGLSKTLTVPAPGVLANDTDADSPPSSLKAVLVSGVANGTLALNADGSFTYIPNSGYSGSDSFTYKANNGFWSRDPVVPMSADSNVATVTITVLSKKQK